MIPLPRKPKKRTETTISLEVRNAVNRIPGVRVVRNNVGMLEDKTGRRVTYGLGKGSPDWIGIITIGRLPFAFGLEVKKPGETASAEQRAWHRAAKARGLLVYVVTDVQQAVECVRLARAIYTELARKLVLGDAA